MILGNNGYVWLSRAMTDAEKAEKDARDKEEDQTKIEKACQEVFDFYPSRFHLLALCVFTCFSHVSQLMPPAPDVT